MNYKYLLLSLCCLALSILSYKDYKNWKKKSEKEIKSESDKAGMGFIKMSGYWPLIFFTAFLAFAFFIQAFE